MSNYLPPTSAAQRKRSRWWIVALVILALGAGVLLDRLLFPTGDTGRTDGPAATGQPPTSTPPPVGAVGGPHGPAKVTSGVPSGYTRDKAGAATAAANIVQLRVAIAHGQADPATVQRTWIAGNADDTARSSLGGGVATTGDDQTNKLPATARITAFTDDSATVEIWVLSVGTTPGATGARAATDWSTTTCTLTWEQGDWKLRSLRKASGPAPDQNTNTTGLQTGGQYTFYIG